MSTRLKLALAVAAVALYIVAGVALLVVTLSSELSGGERDVVERALSREAAVLVLGAGLFLFGLAALVSALLRPHLVVPRRLARQTELIATANPAHRVEAHGPAELRELGGAINHLADRSQAAREGVERQIAAARADLEEERNRLAALMSELTLAVLVCNADGRILLYNAAATELLSREDGTALVGLGRSIFGILDRSLVAHALERIGARTNGAAPAPVHLTAAIADDRLLRIGMAPVGDRHGELSGFVLILDDVTHAAHQSLRRDALLRSLTEGTRAAVGNIRAAVESMLEYPNMDPADRGRFVVIIREEALTLSDRVGRALEQHDADPGDGWLRAEMLGRDLLAAARVALEREAGVAAGVDDDEGELWLGVDSYALVHALVHLARRARGETGVDRFTLRLRKGGRHARLDLVWQGPPLHEETLRAWTAEPIGTERAGGATIGVVVARHGGELWGQAEEDGRSARVRLLLPLADPVRASRQPRAPSSADARPAFYDFDLFRWGERGAAWDSEPLDRLPCTVFDTETTGLSPTDDELISIGAVRIVNGRLLRQETFERLIDPGRPVPPESQAVHGISTEMVAGQPSIQEVLPRFARFAEDTLLVGHNVAFDLRFFELEEGRTGVRFDGPVLDTLLLSGVVHPEEEDHSLEAMAARLGINVVGRHTALGDAILTGEVFLRQVTLLAARGLVTLGQVREAARRTYLARVSDSLYTRG